MPVKEDLMQDRIIRVTAAINGDIEGTFLEQGYEFI